MNKKGISLVALVITIIVLIILTAAVVVTGINTPQNTEYAIKMYNQSMVQDAVTLYIMTSMLDEFDSYDPTSGAIKAPDVSTFIDDLYKDGKWVKPVVNGEKGASARLGINMTEAELDENFTLSPEGVVGWISGKAPQLEGGSEATTPSN